MPILRFTTDIPVIRLLKFDNEAETLTVRWSGIENANKYRVNLGTAIDQPFSAVEIPEPNFEDGAYSTSISLVNEIGITDFINGATQLFASVSPIILGETWPASNIATLNLEVESNVGYNGLSLLVVAGPSGSNNLGIIVVEE